MQGLQTPNGYLIAAKTSGDPEDEFAIPTRTRIIEVWAKDTSFQVGVSGSDADMLGSTTDAAVAVAGAAAPLVFRVNPASDYPRTGADVAPGALPVRQYTYVHYKLAAAADGTITINFFR